MEIDNSFNGKIDEEVKLQLPPGTELLSSQVAGHQFGTSKNKLGVLKHIESGDILKPITDKRSERECTFYRELFSDDDNINKGDECRLKLRKFVPTFKGIFNDIKMNVNYIRLKNCSDIFPNSSVLDMKIGAITYDPEASEEKRRSEMGKYKYATELGFRILGMRIYNKATNRFTFKDKHYGASLTPDNVSQALLTFVQLDVDLLEQFRLKLVDIEDWFQNHNIDRWKFISSSLLFVYDGGSDLGGGCGGQQCRPTDLNSHHQSLEPSPQSQPQQHCDNDKCSRSNNNIETNLNQSNHHNRTIVKMIDFAHVFPNPDHIDQNYVFGLNNLIVHLKRAIELATHQP